MKNLIGGIRKRTAMIFGLDLGNFSLKLVSNQSDQFFNCLNSVIVDKEDNYIFEVDQNDLEQFDRLNKSKKEEKCFNNSRVRNFEGAQFLLKRLIKPLKSGVFWRFNTLVVAINPKNSELDNLSLSALCKDLRLGKVKLVNSDYARAQGLGLNLSEDSVIISLDLGLQTSRLSIVSNTGIIAVYDLEFNTEEIISTINQFLFYEYRLEIANSSIQHAIIDNKTKIVVLNGKDADTGLPKNIKLSLNKLLTTLNTKLENLAKNINNLLQAQGSNINNTKTSYYLVGGIFNNSHISKELGKQLKFPFRVAKYPERIMALGCLKIAKQLKS